MNLPLKEIAGAALNKEQQFYLEGVFAGLRNRGVSFGDVVPPPATAPAVDENQTAEERYKRELHPLDAYPVLLEHAAANQAPDKESTYRFKWHGLFYLAPHKEGFMARLRIPGGQLKSFQLREIARIAEELTTGYVQVTTRSNLQVRLIAPRDTPAFLTRVQSVGLHTRGTGADNVRNLTCNPTAGLDPFELIDTMPFCHEMGQLILNTREFYNLPRKFNIAFDGGGLIGSLEDTNDIGLSAVRLPVETAGVPAGVYFLLKLGGATGHKAFATDASVLIPAAEAVKFTAACLKVYIANGDRTNRKKARLKHLLETWTEAQFVAEAEKLYGQAVPRLNAEIRSQLEFPKTTELPHSHVGVHSQKQPGLNFVGVALPAGQITPRQLLRLAELADQYGSGELRLTVWQNVIIPNVADSAVESMKRSLLKMGLDWRQSNIKSGLVACTGNSYCKFAAANTKKHGLELTEFLEKSIELDQPLNIHLTGCPNSCAQHYIGDIGLLGASVKISGETLEGYHLFVGGGFGKNQSLGRQVFFGLPFSDVKTTVLRMLRVFQEKRNPGETFQAFTTRHDLNQLQQLFSPQ